jgi:hypothetical protein
MHKKQLKLNDMENEKNDDEEPPEEFCDLLARPRNE